MTKPRSLRRHLLALGTFLVPLVVLAWIAWSELARQASQARNAVKSEALQFLAAAAAALERRLDETLPQLAGNSVAALQQGTPAVAVRQLRRQGYGQLLDIVLLDEDGRLRYPEPATQRLGLPFHAGPRNEDPNANLHHLADLLLTRGQFEDAGRHLRQALADLPAPSPRRRLDALVQEIPLRFRLATVERKLGHAAAAETAFQRTVRLVDELRQARPGRWFDRYFDADVLACGLLAELALAEAADDADPRCDLLAAIAAGDRDHLGEGLLQSVAERAAAGVLVPERERADELLAAAVIHLHTRAFATDYNRNLLETVGRRLRASPDPGLAPDLRLVITAGNPSELLLLRRAEGEELERAAWIGLRLDLAQVLTAAVERYVRGDGSFVLAITDGFGASIVAPPKSPEDYSPPALASHGMMLSAWPADVDSFLANARATQRGSLLLVTLLCLAAASGALWLWRSVSRESELLALKVDLVSRVSHELKTPLALISLYGETLGLKRAKDADQAAQFGSIIARESARLTTMIQRILDFSRQEAGTLSYQCAPADLAPTLQQLVDMYTPQLHARGAALEVELETGLRANVDANALASAVVNLLDNAVKYTRDEAPDRSVRLVLRRDGSHAVIEVLDRGRGVPPGEREAVFDSFYRASNAGEVRGAGLGLHLVRHFAAAHGGSIAALPRPGGGSIFRLQLPLLLPSTP